MLYGGKKEGEKDGEEKSPELDVQKEEQQRETGPEVDKPECDISCRISPMCHKMFLTQTTPII